jgi:hypothetical protein
MASQVRARVHTVPLRVCICCAYCTHIMSELNCWQSGPWCWQSDPLRLLILTWLPPPPSQVLDMGINIRTTVKKSKAGGGQADKGGGSLTAARLERRVVNCLSCGRIFDCRAVTNDTIQFLGERPWGWGDPRFGLAPFLILQCAWARAPPS